MKAKYIGTNGSMGFKTGKTYNIFTHCKVLNSQPVIIVYCNNDDSWCPYSSLESLLENWLLIDHLKSI